MKTSAYTSDLWAHKEELMEEFPKGVICPICQRGEFEIQFIDARTNGRCSSCQTEVRFQFYDTRFPFLEHLKQRQEKDKLRDEIK